VRRFAARIKPRQPGRMNKLEAAYADHLARKLRKGEVLEYKFESLKFRLADKTYYTPDFLVIMADGIVEIHEVKGFWMDDARVKIKVAAEQFPFVFRAVKRFRGGWDYETFKE
jgi:hypothetical protein